MPEGPCRLTWAQLLSRVFQLDVLVCLGFMLTNRDYDLASRDIDDMNVASVFMRVILGYSL